MDPCGTLTVSLIEFTSAHFKLAICCLPCTYFLNHKFVTPLNPFSRCLFTQIEWSGDSTS